jgi:general nucleoside transport system permease protein
MDFLFEIPVIGLLFQFAAYLIQVMPDLAPIILGICTPIAFGALCGVMNERSGVVNIGIEGMMLMSAFFGFIAAGWTADAIGGAEFPGPFSVTIPLLLGVVIALVTSILLSALHAWVCISVKADQIISGVIINLLAFGLTGYLNRIFISPNPGLGAGTFSSLDPPGALVDIPIVGWLFDMFLNQGPISMSLIVFVIGLQLFLFRSRWGLRTRAVGEHPRAADTLGIDVIRVRYRNVILGGVFAGLAGAYLTLEQVGSFQNGMTAGRGFIALACVIFGRWTPIGAFGAALLFAGTEVFGRAVSISPPSGNLAPLGEILGAVPQQFYGVLPYIVTIIILAGVVGRSIPPAADGRPYEKEGKAA